MTLNTEVLVIGAGMSGITAARVLQNSGREVLVLDKGRGVGGRMATRRIGDAIFDHGAQFITARTAHFLKEIKEWEKAGVAKSWCKGFTEKADGHTRWRGDPAMNVIPKHLSKKLTIQLETRVELLTRVGDGWEVETDGGGHIFAESIMLTAPVPQSLELIDAGNIQIETQLRQQLARIEYDRCIAVMATFTTPSLLAAPGGFAPLQGPVAWIADNQKKGISPKPSVTIHGAPSFSRLHWDDEREKVGQLLIEAASTWLGETPQSIQVHGWKYSRPTSLFPATCAVVCRQPLLVLAGDAFAGPKVEGAAISGWAAAKAVLDENKNS